MDESLKIQLSVEDGIRAKSFLDACDARLAGYREGLAAAKLEFVRYLAAQKPPAEPAKEE